MSLLTHLWLSSDVGLGFKLKSRNRFWLFVKLPQKCTYKVMHKGIMCFRSCLFHAINLPHFHIHVTMSHGLYMSCTAEMIPAREPPSVKQWSLYIWRYFPKIYMRRLEKTKMNPCQVTQLPARDANTGLSECEEITVMKKGSLRRVSMHVFVGLSAF